MSNTDTNEILLFAESLRYHAERSPDAPAMHMPDGSRTYGELIANAEHIAARLQTIGVQPGDRVSFLSLTCCRVMEAAIAAAMVRALPVPLSTSVTPETLNALFNDCAPKIVFVAPQFVGFFEAADYPNLHVVLLQPDETVLHYPDIDAWMAMDPTKYIPVAGDPNDLLTLIYSSGTTGVPKGIARRNAKWAEFWTAHGKIGGGMQPGARFLLTTAFYTTGTFVSLFSTLYNGGEAGALASFNTEDFIQRVGRGEVTGTFLIPMQMRRVMDSPSYSLERMQGLTYTLMAGAICDPPTKQRIIDNWPGTVVDMYGTSETATLAVSDIKNSPGYLNSVGQIYPGSKVAIVGEAGHQQPVGEVGEIVGWTPSMMEGYYNRPDLTEALYWKAADGSVYLRTGDVGYLDDKNNLFVTDRKKDMIVSGGANIYSSDIEAVLMLHGDVNEVAVIAIPSDRWGETPYGIVVPSEGMQLDPQELLSWANSRLGKMHRLAGIEFRPELLKNGMGKVLKRELRAPFWADREVKVA